MDKAKLAWNFFVVYRFFCHQTLSRFIWFVDVSSSLICIFETIHTYSNASEEFYNLLEIFSRFSRVHE